MSADLFLSSGELDILTGKKTRPAQIKALKAMLVPFRINAVGKPIVTRSAVEGIVAARMEPQNGAWKPGLAGSR